MPRQASQVVNTHTHTLKTTRLNPACHVVHCCAPQYQCVPLPHETTRAHPCQACCMLHIACLVVAHFPLPCTNSHLLGPGVGTLLHLTGLVLHVVALGWRRALCVDKTVVPFHTCCRCHTAPSGGFVLSQPVNTSDGQCAVAHTCIFNRIAARISNRPTPGGLMATAVRRCSC